MIFHMLVGFAKALGITRLLFLMQGPATDYINSAATPSTRDAIAVVYEPFQCRWLRRVDWSGVVGRNLDDYDLFRGVAAGLNRDRLCWVWCRSTSAVHALVRCQHRVPDHPHPVRHPVAVLDAHPCNYPLAQGKKERMMTSQTPSVILDAGPIGRSLTEILISKGKAVTAVSRNGRDIGRCVPTHKADLSNIDQPIAAC